VIVWLLEAKYNWPMPAEYHDFIAAHRERRQREQERARKREELAHKAAEEAAEQLALNLGVTGVYLFGSLARGQFGSRSDIDLAVEGLVPGKLVDALGIVERNRAFEFDVLPLDAVRPEVAEAVRREGIRLWPR
jgi:predicted nucleotidyltransferase